MLLTLGLSAYWQSVVIVAGIGALAALGLQLTIDSGQFSLVHGALMGSSAYVTGLACVKLGSGFWPSVLLGGATGAILGALVSVIVLRLSGVLLSLATLAIGQALSLFAANSSYLGSTTGYTGVPLRTEVWQVVLCLLVGLSALLMLRQSRIGLGVVAVGRDPVVAQSLGIPVSIIKVCAFAAGGTLAGVAGALNVQYLSFVDPTALNFSTEVQLLLFVVIGGMTSPAGAVLGAFGITIASELLRFAQLDRAWLLGLILVVVALSRPQGLLSRRSVGVPVRLAALKSRRTRSVARANGA